MPHDETPSAGPGEITALLASARQEQPGANERLYELVYDDLRRLARHHARRPAARNQGPGATSLVHEAFLRLARPAAAPIADREHFFAVASRAMRQIVIDDLRARHADKRGGGALLEPIERAEEAVGDDAAKLESALAVDRELAQLERHSPRLARVVEWHFFGGLTFEEIGAALGVTERTVLRDWRAARAILHLRLSDGGVLAAGGDVGPASANP